MIVIVDKNNFSRLLKDLKASNLVSIDTETDSLDTLSCHPLLVQIKVGEDVYVFDARKQNKVIKYIISIIKDTDKLCLFHNAKFDLKIIYRVTGEWIRNVYDTMIAEVLIHQGAGKQYYSLEELVSNYCQVSLDKSVRESFYDFDLSKEFTQEQIIYSSMDVLYLETVMGEQLKQIDEQKQNKTLLLENQLVSVVAKMEFRGIPLDSGGWLNLEKKWVEQDLVIQKEMLDLVIEKVKKLLDTKSTEEVVKLLSIPVTTKKGMKLLTDMNILPPNEKEIQFISWLKTHLNLDSNKQNLFIANNLFGVNLVSTNEKKITKHRNSVKFISLLLDHRELEKRRSTYGSNFLKNIHPATGAIHSEFNQVGTYTGRFASSGPDLQNIPKMNEYRSCFIARPGYKIVTADYSQAELRILAWVSQEPEMISAFMNKVDLHKKSASFLLDKDISILTDDDRKLGKTFNFALVYGTTEYGLFNNFGIPIDKGREYLKKYFEGYKVLAYFIEKAGEFIIKAGFSTTPLGRKRFFKPAPFLEDWKEREKRESKTKREGINHIIQGGSADAIKRAMVRIDTENPLGDDTINILIQVHDELVCEVREDLVEKGRDFIVKMMSESEQPFVGKIDAIVDSFIGDFWRK